MADSTARALALLRCLTGRPHWTSAELMTRLGVSDRTIRRDVARLRELGYDVQATPGVAGGYAMRRGHALPPLTFDDDDAIAIADGLLRTATDGPPELAESALRVMAQIDQLLPNRLHTVVSSLAATTTAIRLHPDAHTSTNTHLMLASAIRERRRVRFSYRTWDGHTSDRDLEPHRLLTANRRWYLFGWDHLRGDWRMFRLDRMSELATTTLMFTQREAPDAAALLRDAIRYSPGATQLSVVFSAPSKVVRQVIPAHVGDVVDVTGGCRFDVAVDDVDLEARHILMAAVSIGARLTDAQPPAFAAALRGFAQDIAASIG